MIALFKNNKPGMGDCFMTMAHETVNSIRYWPNFLNRVIGSAFAVASEMMVDGGLRGTEEVVA
jgi:hypothetical protein